MEEKMSVWITEPLLRAEYDGHQGMMFGIKEENGIIVVNG